MTDLFMMYLDMRAKTNHLEEVNFFNYIDKMYIGLIPERQQMNMTIAFDFITVY